jgi:histidine triad (HIT) family protein
VAAACAFCGILSGEVTAEVVLEEREVLAFLDRRPVFKGHLLVVPRAHIVTLADLPAELVEPLFAAVQRCANAMPQAVGSQGSWVSINNVVSQSVPHLHVHVVPRTKGDGLRGFFWPRTTYADAAEMAGYAARLRRVLGESAAPT